MKKNILLLINLSLFIAGLFSNGNSEAAASGQHGKYLAGQGIIIPADDILETGYIAQLDYDYPPPTDGDFGIYLYSGNRQLSNAGQDEIIHIGIKANKTNFEDLPPLNLSFVIDTSGSMRSDDKLNWVKDSFNIFIDKVRDIDYVSLISFNSESEVIFNSTQMNNLSKRDMFRDAVQNMRPGGGTNLISGLEDGYDQVLSTYRDGYSNRVLFLTDGVGQSNGMLDMAKRYKEMGINVSTIGVGKDFDVNLMVDLAKAGGGSSRFISDSEQMKKIFGTELDRMVVPAARNLKMTLEVPEWIEILDTWGYRNKKEKHRVSYTLPTLHNGDYETILAKVKIRPNNLQGSQEVAKFTITYDNLLGKETTLKPVSVFSTLVDDNSIVSGVSDYTVLRSSTMLYLSQSLKNIANIFYGTNVKVTEVNQLRATIWNNKYPEGSGMEYDEEKSAYEAITSDEIEVFEREISSSLNEALTETLRTRRILTDTKMMLDNIGFEDEIEILDHYVDILKGELQLTDIDLTDHVDNVQLAKKVRNRSVDSYLESLFNEINISLGDKNSINLMLSPFLYKDNSSSDLGALINQNALITLSTNENITMLERSKFDEILEQQELTLSGLVDINQAITVGELLSAEYIITGNIIPMRDEVIVFARVINIESSEIEVISRVVIPRTDEVSGLL